MNDANRAILLTPPGPAAIAVVRVSGPGLSAFLGAHFTKQARAGRCVHGELRDGDRVIDDPVVVLSEDGAFADINLHGGPWVVAATLELLERRGFTVGDAGDELTRMSVAEGDLLTRELLASVPLATTVQGLEALLAQPEAWRTFRASATIDDVRRVLADQSLWWLLHPPRVAIVGAANVGKSTLANQLFAQERSITADLPGTTRDWVGETANLDGLPITLADTPGLRETNDPIEQAAIDRSRDVIQSADAVVLVLDASRPVVGEQQTLIDRFPTAIRVLNKIDLAQSWTGHLADAVQTIATTGQGVDDLRLAIRTRFGCREFDSHLPRWWTRRQRDVLERAVRDTGHLGELFERPQ